MLFGGEQKMKNFERIRILTGEMGREITELENIIIKYDSYIRKQDNKIKKAIEYLNGKTATDVLTCRRDIMDILEGVDKE